VGFFLFLLEINNYYQHSIFQKKGVAMSWKTNLLSLSAIALLTACTSNPTQSTSIGEIPSWVLNPQVEDGIAVSECVIYSGNMSIDRQEVMANARASLAQRIETQVSVLDKIYKEKVTGIGDSASSIATFSSVSKQITQQTLNGITPLKTDIIKIQEKDNYCMMVGIEQASTKALFDSLAEKSKRPMSDGQKEMLFDSFKSQKAAEQLEEELKK